MATNFQIILSVQVRYFLSLIILLYVAIYS